MQFWDWVNYLTQFGYLGVFLISLTGAMSVIIPIPYTLVILTLGIRGMDPLLLAVAGGLGSGLGEFAGYILGYYGRTMIKEERQRKMNYIMKFFDRYGPITIFLFALTPLPDDLLFIPLGILRYKFVKAFVPCFIGKLFMCYILAYGGRLYSDFLLTIFGEGGWAGTILTAILLILVLVVMLKIDWEKIFERYVVKGVEKG